MIKKIRSFVNIFLFLVIFLAIFLFTSSLTFATAPSLTVVTVTLQDSSTQVWANATWQTNFVQPFGNPNTPSNNGNPIMSNQSGVADGSGTFTVTLDDNQVVTPANSMWQFLVCPNATVRSCDSISISVTGASENLSSSINAILTVPFVSSSPTIARAYRDSEANGGFGALYINTTDNTLHQCVLSICSGTGWVVITVSINNPVFTGTLTVPCVKFDHDPSNDSTLCSQAGTGHINFLLPTVAGTLASNATSPIILDSTTGNISCPTCSTGGATFPLFAPDSNLSTPQYSFANQHTTGLYRDNATGDIRFSYNSTDLTAWVNGSFKVSGVGNLCITQGDAASPCYFHFAPGGGNILVMTDDFSGGNGTFQSDFSLVKQYNQLVTQPYLLGGFEVTTPLAAGAGLEKGYYKAGHGWCAIDSGSVEYCTVNTATPSNVAILAYSATTSLTNTTYGNANTTIITTTVTMPSSGCPCRVRASWWLYLDVSASGQDVAYVSDGTAGFAGAETATAGSASGFGFNSSGEGTVTYANSAPITFSLIAAGSHAGSTTVHTTQQGTSITGAPVSSLIIAVMPSN